MKVRYPENIRCKRVYESPDENDGYRVLVDRIWPRGIKKSELKLDEWCRELAPSAALRQWFARDTQHNNALALKMFLEKCDQPA